MTLFISYAKSKAAKEREGLNDDYKYSKWIISEYNLAK